MISTLLVYQSQMSMNKKFVSNSSPKWVYELIYPMVDAGRGKKVGENKVGEAPEISFHSKKGTNNQIYMVKY